MTLGLPGLEVNGVALVKAVMTPAEVEGWRERLGPALGAGRRGMLKDGMVRELAWSARLLSLVRPFVPDVPRPVRAIYFNKSPDVNWLVPWHQDLTLALRERREVPGFGPWSVKEGVPHVQPPVELLERMLTIRLHLDDADARNGALAVIPGSHALGRLDAARIADLRKDGEVLCEAQAGDVLLMRPLILHASGRSEGQRQRRILHIEYAGFELPGGLEWRE